jgi:ATP:corrinoid adenosyltransferase
MNHTQRMQRKKAVVDAKVGSAGTARGVFLIHTGSGKGKL